MVEFISGKAIIIRPKHGIRKSAGLGNEKAQERLMVLSQVKRHEKNQKEIEKLWKEAEKFWKEEYYDQCIEICNRITCPFSHRCLRTRANSYNVKMFFQKAEADFRRLTELEPANEGSLFGNSGMDNDQTGQICRRPE